VATSFRLAQPRLYGPWHRHCSLPVLQLTEAALLCCDAQDAEGASKGAGIVEFERARDALHAISTLSNSTLGGRQIHVSTQYPLAVMPAGFSRGACLPGKRAESAHRASEQQQVPAASSHGLHSMSRAAGPHPAAGAGRQGGPCCVAGCGAALWRRTLS
jgi:hypothetical protein